MVSSPSTSMQRSLHGRRPFFPCMVADQAVQAQVVENLRATAIGINYYWINCIPGIPTIDGWSIHPKTILNNCCQNWRSSTRSHRQLRLSKRVDGSWCGHGTGSWSWHGPERRVNYMLRGFRFGKVCQCFPCCLTQRHLAAAREVDYLWHPQRRRGHSQAAKKAAAVTQITSSTKPMPHVA